MDKENKKELKVVSGDSSNLNFSPVYEHLNSAKPTTQDKKPKNIVVPETKKDKKKDKNEEDED